MYQATRTKRSLRGKTVLLTGAGTGLGRATAFALAREGCKIVVWDINAEALDKTCADVRAAHAGAEVFPYAVNLADRAAVYALAERVKSERGPVWGIINNAGIISGTPLLSTDDSRIELSFKVNALAHFWVVKAFLPDMIAKNDGRIVGISSAAGFCACHARGRGRRGTDAGSFRSVRWLTPRAVGGATSRPRRATDAVAPTAAGAPT